MRARLSTQDCFAADHERLMEDAVCIVREAVTHYRTRVGTVVAIERVAGLLHISANEARELFYRIKQRLDRDRYLALKAAAIAELDARANELEERMRAARIRRLQHEHELAKIEEAWGVSAHWPRNSPAGQPA
jgi:hypothetical protein